MSSRDSTLYLGRIRDAIADIASYTAPRAWVVLVGLSLVGCKTDAGVPNSGVPEVASESRGIALSPVPSASAGAVSPAGGPAMPDAGAASAAQSEEARELMEACGGGARSAPCRAATEKMLERRREADWNRSQKENGGFTLPDGGIRKTPD